MKNIKSPALSLVIGGAGFIGVNLCKRLLEQGRTVVVIDNLSRGREEYLANLQPSARLRFHAFNVAKRDDCLAAFDAATGFGEIDEVWHLAANSDIPAGVADSDVDLRDTFLTTFEILRAMKQHGVRKLYFASSSAIYGDLGDIPIVENIGPLLPISNYGAMKLASEAQCSAAAESYLDSVCLFRFPNVVGVPATHGVILDFVRKLHTNPQTLPVLGDGSQQKAYLHVSDLVDAMLFVRSRPNLSRVYPINIGPIDEGVTVRWIAQQVVARTCPDAVIQFGTGNKGWVGDVPKFHYSTARLTELGWTPALGSEAAVRRAVDEIATQEGFPRQIG